MRLRAQASLKKGELCLLDSPYTHIFEASPCSSTSSRCHCFHCHDLLSDQLDFDPTPFACLSCHLLFCSQACLHSNTTHPFTCCNQLYADFQTLSRQYQRPLFEYAARIWIHILAKATRGSIGSRNEVKLRMDQELKELYSAYPLTSSSPVLNESELEDSYCLLTAALLAGISVDNEYFNEVMTLERWKQLVQILRTYLIPIHIEHPAVDRVVEISRIPGTRERLEKFGPYEKYAEMAVRSLDPNFDFNDESPLAVERRLTRLVQAVTSSGSSHPLTRFAFDGYGLSPDIGKIAHSCIPNVHVDTKRTNGRIVFEGVALFDIPESEPLTRSFLDSTDAFYSERSEALHRVFGPTFDCLCLKCDFERHAGRQVFYEPMYLSIEEMQSEHVQFAPLYQLAATYMQDQQFMAVLNIGKHLIQSNDVTGDVYHLIGAALLSMDLWSEAHWVWGRGLALFPNHTLLKNEMLKYEVYSTANALEASTTPCNFIMHRSAESGRIISSEGAVIDAAECAMVVAAAEEFAAAGSGWTTSRHYAVPTTDIPLHLLPDVADWFNRLISTKIAPAFIKYFGKGVCWVRIHDAFVVKYHCSETSPSQRYLPLHSDESTHSFVLALNPASEYEGGGTYFVDLGHTLRPGKLASFTFNSI